MNEGVKSKACIRSELIVKSVMAKSALFKIEGISMNEKN